MKNVFLVFIFIHVSLIILAQDTTYHKLPQARENIPLVIINSGIIGALDSISPNDINKIDVYKDNSIPGNLRNLGRYGIISISTKQFIRTKTFAEIKNWLEVKSDAKIAVDGFYIDDETLLIAANSIKEIDIINDQAQKVINIWTLSADKRKESLPYQNDPPGTIHIRGIK